MYKVVRNGNGNVSREDVNIMGVRYKQWLRMSRHRQNQRINKHNIVEYLLSI